MSDPKTTATNVNEPFNLAYINMPLVRMLVDCRLSWHERQTIADAINQNTIQWGCLMAEHNRHNCLDCGGQKEVV